MEVILQEDFPALGYVGDKIKVRGGYARNYLLPRGIAVEASSRNAKLLKHRLGGINARRVKLRAVAEELSKKLEGMRLEFMLRVGAGGKTFGSITVRDLEDALRKEGYVLDKRQIIVREPLKKAGEHQVSIKLHSEVVCNILVQINTEVPEQKAKAAEGAEGEKPVAKGKATRKPRAKKAAKDGEEGAAEEAQAAPEAEEQKVEEPTE